MPRPTDPQPQEATPAPDADPAADAPPAVIPFARPDDARAREEEADQRDAEAIARFLRVVLGREEEP